MFSLPFIIILFAGQTFSHFPHPTHLSSETFAKQPLCTLIAPNGQAFSQAPQATQIVLSTAANRLDAIFIPPILVCFIAVYHILTAASVTRSHSKNSQNIKVTSCGRLRSYVESQCSHFSSKDELFLACVGHYAGTAAVAVINEIIAVFAVKVVLYLSKCYNCELFGRYLSMRKKRGFFTQFIRHLIQLAAFILFPGLFITVFSAVRDLVAAVMEGRFSFSGLFPQIILVCMVLLVTVLWGRFFCGFLCSFGMVQELLFFFPGRFIFRKVRIPEKLDSVMKFLKYVILAFITAGVWILALPVDSSWNPWGVFGMLVSGNLSVVTRAVSTLGFVLLLAIAAGSLVVSRFFCRYFCPLGALFALVSGKRLYKIRRSSDSCTDCGLCTRTCSMGIRIPERDAVASGECIQCMQCISVCPKESLSASPSGAIAGTAAAAAIGGTVLAGSLISLPAAETISSDGQSAEKEENGSYKDGVYTGEGEGFRGTTKVQVTVEDGYIADITVLSFRDDREFFQRAQSAVIDAILTDQTADVDAVSGATFSSNSIMDAVADALGNESGRQEQPGGREDGDEPESPGEGGEGQPGAGRPEEGEEGQPGTEHLEEGEEGQPGTEHPGEGGGNGHGSGEPGTGGNRRGPRDGSGRDRHRGRREREINQ